MSARPFVGACILFLLSVQDVGPQEGPAINRPPIKLLTAYPSLSTFTYAVNVVLHLQPDWGHLIGLSLS